MQISSFSLTSPSVSAIKASNTTSAPATASATTEQSETSFTNSADSFSNLVAQASQTPDVRSDLVDSFKSRIASGQYPTSDTIDSLTDTLGSSIFQLADSAQD